MRSVATPVLPPQRVAMLSVHSCPLATLGGRETGGMNVYVRELSRHLSDLGIAVDVYTRRQDPCYPTVVDFADQARVIHLPAGPAAPYSKHRVWDHLPEFVDGVQDFINEHALQYDVIHSHYWLSGWVAMQLRLTLDLPIVHMSHTLGYPKNAAAQLPWEQEPSRRLQVERTVLQGSDALVAESPASKRHMVWHYDVDPASVAVIPCGVDMARFRPRDKGQARADLSLPPAAPILLFVGRLQPSKGIDTLLRAAATLSVATDPDVYAFWSSAAGLMIGTSRKRRNSTACGRWETDWGCATCTTSRRSPRRNWPSTMPPPTFSSCRRTMNPSAWWCWKRMACGTPVVASEVGGLASTVIHGDSGLLVPPGDWRAFAQAISRLLASPQLQNTMRRAGP